jgi:hypothetical protein
LKSVAEISNYIQ